MPRRRVAGAELVELALVLEVDEADAPEPDRSLVDLAVDAAAALPRPQLKAKRRPDWTLDLSELRSPICRVPTPTDLPLW